MNILILGAGPCGLGAAYYLNKLGHTVWQLFERNMSLSLLRRTAIYGGFIERSLPELSV